MLFVHLFYLYTYVICTLMLFVHDYNLDNGGEISIQSAKCYWHDMGRRGMR